MIWEANPTIWIHCPICGSKTLTKVYEDTAINVVKLKMVRCE